jgi:predicted dehydrogenase
MMRNRLRVAVVGVGIGGAHVRAYRELSEQFEVVALCDLDLQRAQTVADANDIAVVTPHFDELCQRDDIDIVDLCTPPFLHFAQIQQALAAGKHVICEKPLVRSVQEIDELIVAQANAGRVVMPIFQYRFGHGLQKLKFLADCGLVGRAYLATAEVAWRRRADYYAVPWRGKRETEFGGTVLIHAIHAIDMLSYILGPVRSVFAHTTTRVNPIEVEDCAVVGFEMADGSLASLAVTLGSTVEITRHRFCFANLTAESHTHPYTNASDPWTFTSDTAAASAQIAAALAEFRPQPEGFAGQFSRLAHALASNGPLPVSLYDARAALTLIDALYESAATGGRITLP